MNQTEKDVVNDYIRDLYVDCELSDKQFQLRYTGKESGQRHIFLDIDAFKDWQQKIFTSHTSTSASPASSKTTPPQPIEQPTSTSPTGF